MRKNTQILHPIIILTNRLKTIDVQNTFCIENDIHVNLRQYDCPLELVRLTLQESFRLINCALLIVHCELFSSSFPKYYVNYDNSCSFSFSSSFKNP